MKTDYVLVEARCLTCGVKWSERVVPESSSVYEESAEAHVRIKEGHEVIVTALPISFRTQGEKVLR